ncbi:MAG: GNAT family N-acetyltransferase [Nocardioides sp.]
MTESSSTGIDGSVGRVQVREAREADFVPVCDIINHYILTTPVNFRTEPQAPDEWIADFRGSRERYPWLVADIGGAVAGVAYGNAWKARHAYDWTVESTVYVRNGLRRGGIGRALYERLLAILEAQGFRTVLAVIQLPNPGSTGFHETFGYRQVGHLVDAGFKLGDWRDIGFWQRRLRTEDGPPGKLLTVREASAALRSRPAASGNQRSAAS